jgi:capsular exopolysaccharide synthesis family protein
MENGTYSGNPSGDTNGSRPRHTQSVKLQLPDEEDFNIGEYWGAILRGKYIILTIFIGAILAALFVNSIQRDLYQAKLTMIVRDNASTTQAILGLGFDIQRRSLTNEIRIIQSRSVAEATASKLIQQLYIDPQTRTDTLPIILSQTGSIDKLENVAARVLDGVTIQPIKETDILEINFSSYNPVEAAIVANLLAETYKERTLKYSQNAAITVRAFIQDQLERKRNQLTDAEEKKRQYMQSNRMVSLDAESGQIITQQSKFQTAMEEIGIQLGADKVLLKSYNERLDSLKPQFGRSAVQSIIDPYTKMFQEEIARLQIDRDKKSENPGAAFNRDVQLQVKELNDKIEAYQKRLQQTAEEQMKRGIANIGVDESIRSIITNKLRLELEIAGLETQFSEYKKVLTEYDRVFIKIPEKNLEYVRYERNLKSLEEIYALLEKRYQEALINEKQIPNAAEVIDTAVTPVIPIAPNRTRNMLLASVVGLIMGVGTVVVIKYLDKSVYSPEDAEKFGFSLLATIPIIESFSETVTKSVKRSKVSDGPDEDYRKIAAHLVTHFDAKSSVSEAYRSLRTSILFSPMESRFKGQSAGAKTILVTSSAPREGKSTTIANLAITMAQTGNRVLLIDADLRRPMLHSIFGLSKEPGITNHLIGRSKIEEIIKQTSIPNLDIITSGTIPPNPSELVGTPQMKTFLDAARSNYDIILLDSPPVIAVTDAQIISKLTDGVLLVLSSGVTNRDLVARTIENVTRLNGHIIGLVLNNFDTRNSYGSYYRYYRYDHYYSADGSIKPPQTQGFLAGMFRKFTGKQNI